MTVIRPVGVWARTVPAETGSSRLPMVSVRRLRSTVAAGPAWAFGALVGIEAGEVRDGGVSAPVKPSRATTPKAAAAEAPAIAAAVRRR
ncbi:hypothetical protein [Streptomyces sp. MBT84]|uniref:hypothetical protein n=1 Tax=Streptomyces sp. MBT84 TaxID=1488414 RepID=UPI001C6F2E2D|nr:hypothetical protein [Streptomyces sp. MBT84]